MDPSKPLLPSTATVPAVTATTTTACPLQDTAGSTPIPILHSILITCFLILSDTGFANASPSVPVAKAETAPLSPYSRPSLHPQTGPLSRRPLQRQRLACLQRQRQRQRLLQQHQPKQQPPPFSVSAEPAPSLLSTPSSPNSLSLPASPCAPCLQPVPSSPSCSLAQQDHHRHRRVITPQLQRPLVKRQTLADDSSSHSQQDIATMPTFTLSPESDSDIGSISNSPSASYSEHLSGMATSEKVFYALIAVAVILALFSVGFCLVRARRRSTANSVQLSTRQQQQQSSQQQQQPSLMQERTQHQQQSSTGHLQSQQMSSDNHSTAALSTFTRISPAGPEMSAFLSSARAGESRAGGGFSLVRLLTKHSSNSGSTSSKPWVYQFSHASGKDLSLQKTSSTRSSAHDYEWDLSDFGKQRTKDGFPVITLTSPTSSEVSIPFITLEEHPGSTSSLYPNRSNTGSLLSLATMPPATTALSSSSTAAATTAAEPMTNQAGEEDHFASTNSALSPHLLSQQPSIPEHMLLHPSSSLNIRRSVKHEPTPPPTSTISMSDFPPTYEEALDAGPSNSTSISSHSKESSLSPLPTNHFSSYEAGNTAMYSGSSSSTQSRPSYLDSIDSIHQGVSNGGPQDEILDLDTDPLASLSLSYVASNSS